MKFDEWKAEIEAAYRQVPRTYQDAYADYVGNRLEGADQASAFHAGWLAACGALGNRLMEWLDSPSMNDAGAFLEFLHEIRVGDLRSHDEE